MPHFEEASERTSLLSAILSGNVKLANAIRGATNVPLMNLLSYISHTGPLGNTYRLTSYELIGRTHEAMLTDLFTNWNFPLYPVPAFQRKRSAILRETSTSHDPKDVFTHMLAGSTTLPYAEETHSAYAQKLLLEAESIVRNHQGALEDLAKKEAHLNEQLQDKPVDEAAYTAYLAERSKPPTGFFRGNACGTPLNPFFEQVTELRALPANRERSQKFVTENAAKVQALTRIRDFFLKLEEANPLPTPAPEALPTPA